LRIDTCGREGLDRKSFPVPLIHLPLVSGLIFANVSLPQNGSFAVNALSASGDVSSPYSFADKAHKEQHHITGTQGSGQHPIDIKTDSGDLAIR